MVNSGHVSMPVNYLQVPVHYQNAHSDMKGYQCRLCEMKFKWPRSLDRHVLSVHEGFKFKCTECGILLGWLVGWFKFKCTECGILLGWLVGWFKFKCTECGILLGWLVEGFKFQCTECGILLGWLVGWFKFKCTECGILLGWLVGWFKLSVGSVVLC